MPRLAPGVVSNAAGAGKSWALTGRSRTTTSGRTNLMATMGRAAHMGIGGAVLLALGVSARFRRLTNQKTSMPTFWACWRWHDKLASPSVVGYCMPFTDDSCV